MWLLSEIYVWNVRGGGIKFTNGSSCKECSGNLLGICGYPDPLKTWHFDACESFVEFLSSSDQTKMTATWKMWLLSEINIWNVRGGGLKFKIGSFCKECSGNLWGICGYPDPQKTWHFDACGLFVEFLKFMNTFVALPTQQSCLFLAVQDSSISDIVCLSVCPLEPTNNQSLGSIKEWP